MLRRGFLDPNWLLKVVRVGISKTQNSDRNVYSSNTVRYEQANGYGQVYRCNPCVYLFSFQYGYERYRFFRKDEFLDHKT